MTEFFQWEKFNYHFLTLTFPVSPAAGLVGKSYRLPWLALLLNLLLCLVFSIYQWFYSIEKMGDYHRLSQCWKSTRDFIYLFILRTVLFPVQEAVSELAISFKSSSITLKQGWGACWRAKKGRHWHLLPVKSINWKENPAGARMYSPTPN